MSFALLGRFGSGFGGFETGFGWDEDDGEGEGENELVLDSVSEFGGSPIGAADSVDYDEIDDVN